MKPKRIQRKRTRGWRMPENCRCVTRPGIFGNPFKGERAVRLFRLMMQRRWAELERQLRAIAPGAGETAVLLTMCDLQIRAKQIRDRLGELRGKDLACYCAPDKPCHADVLLELANAGGAP